MPLSRRRSVESSGVANATDDSIDEISPGGSVSTLVGSLRQTYGVAFDAGGKFFEARVGSSNIDDVAPGGSVSSFASRLDSPNGLGFLTACS
jgi:hypothetical protein